MSSTTLVLSGPVFGPRTVGVTSVRRSQERPYVVRSWYLHVGMRALTNERVVCYGHSDGRTVSVQIGHRRTGERGSRSRLEINFLGCGQITPPMFVS